MQRLTVLGGCLIGPECTLVANAIVVWYFDSATCPDFHSFYLFDKTKQNESSLAQSLYRMAHIRPLAVFSLVAILSAAWSSYTVDSKVLNEAVERIILPLKEEISDLKR